MARTPDAPTAGDHGARALAKRRALKAISVTLAALAVLWFILVALSIVFSRGLCCADDAYYAVVAKNLAGGLGYVSTLPLQYGSDPIVPFDPLAGSGPTIILPAAVFIRLFGNTTWVPGVSSVFCWSLMLIGIGVLARRYNSDLGFALSTFAFFLLTYTLTYKFLYEWGALLGEVPAALLLILGALLYFHSDSKGLQLLAGVSFGLAALAKALALLGVGAFVLGLVLLHFLEHGSAGRARLVSLAVRLAYVCLGFVLPLLLFEAWKVVTLGMRAYSLTAGAFWRYVFGAGVRVDQTTFLNELYASRSDALLQTFWLMPPAVLLAIGLAYAAAKSDPTLRRLYVVLVTMVLAYSLWWLFLSVGWPRYFVVPLILTMATVALSFLSAFSWRRLLLSCVALGFMLSGYNWRELEVPPGVTQGRYFQPDAGTKSLLQVADLLAPVVAERTTIVTQFWPSAADMEYIMDTHLNFEYYAELGDGRMSRKPFHLAVNTRFVDGNDLEFGRLLKSCVDVQKIGPYLVGKCNTTPRE